MLPQEPGESLVSATSSPGSIANSGRGLRPVTPTPRLHFEPSHPIGSRTRPVPLPIIRAGSYDIKHPTIIDSSSQKKISQSSDPIVPQLSAISPFPPNLSRASPVAHPYVHLQNRERPSSFSEANRTPSSPIFDTVPIQWKGLTMEQAKWTFSKAELQSLAASAIRQSAEATSIRLLHQRVVDVELPEEIERLETQRDEIKAKYQHQARLRKLLMRSLALYIDGSDTDAAFRLLAEIAEVSVACETLSTDLFVVMDQLAQISRLRDTHMSSALTMALHKLNAAFLRTSAETEDLRETVSLIEADRDEGWAKAFELEHTLDAVRRQLVEVAVDKSTTVPPRGTRVSAARKSSLSKASFRSSSRRSARLSSHNMKMVNLVFPHPPSAFHHDVPAPILPLDANKLPTPVNRLRPESVISRVTSTGVSTPSSTRAMVNAQNEVLELLGLSLIDLDKSPSPANSQRPRPHSLYIPPPDIVVPAPDSPRPTRPASLQVPSSPYSLHTLSPYLRRSSTSILDGSTSSLPHPVISLTPGDPDAIFRAMVSRAGP
ncbi:hypothetical protein BS47DRAFT_196549 [Hydnum rufescens UP504]|uniref:Uncharacterized protein n=1 Tax=Hydnum rufescens UP504 TaxID=1448309 RepID=A0A9P6E1M5_9AGAM|nr:hypothetical protein BS47DRAFT_196549 [Hydnum rufescens UP504]